MELTKKSTINIRWLVFYCENEVYYGRISVMLT